MRQAGRDTNGPAGGTPTLNKLRHVLGDAYTQLFVSMGAAPNAVGTKANGLPTTTFSASGPAPTFVWNIPQGTVTGSVNPGSGQFTGVPTNVLDSFEVTVFDSTGTPAYHSGTQPGPTPATNSQGVFELPDWANFVAQHGAGQYTWQVRGWWSTFANAAGNDGYWSQAVAFTIVVP